jgi:hypothetical protein
MSTLNKTPRYEAYLLRFWQEQRQNTRLPAIWRFSLEDPHTGQRHGFATLEALFNFLQTQLIEEHLSPDSGEG